MSTTPYQARRSALFPRLCLGCPHRRDRAGHGMRLAASPAQRRKKARSLRSEPMDSRHFLRTVAMALLVISLVAGSAACGPASVSPNGSASPASPGASRSPSASAGEVPLGTAGAAVGGALGGTSPAPSVDVAALFTKAMLVPFRANASVEGEM